MLLTGLQGTGSNRGYAYVHVDLEEVIDEFVTEILQCREIVGLNLVVVQGEKTKIAKGYGFADLGHPTEVDETTLFGIASLTKGFAATLLGILIDEHDR
jgi:beta-lactamase class C